MPQIWRRALRAFPLDISLRRYTVWVQTRIPPSARHVCQNETPVPNQSFPVGLWPHFGKRRGNKDWDGCPIVGSRSEESFTCGR